MLGHIQRGGTPTAFDRWLATRFGLHAIQAVHEGDFGKMVALRGTEIVRVPLAEGTRSSRPYAPSLRRSRNAVRLNKAEPASHRPTACTEQSRRRAYHWLVTHPHP